MINNLETEYIKIGQAIRKRRKELKLSQKQLSERIPKLDRSKISDMENGKEDFVFSTLIKICIALETTLEDLLQEKK